MSNNPLAKWPILHTNLYTEHDYNPELGFFQSALLKDLCLARLGLTTYNMHLNPDRVFNNIHILHMSHVTQPLDNYGWINIPNEGLVHLTYALPQVHPSICMF